MSKTVMSASERSETAKSYCEFGEALFNFVGNVIPMSFSIIVSKKIKVYNNETFRIESS